jgi:hypothetical protein
MGTMATATTAIATTATMDMGTVDAVLTGTITMAVPDTVIAIRETAVLDPVMIMEEIIMAADTAEEGMAVETDSAAADGPTVEDRMAVDTAADGPTVAAIVAEDRTAVDTVGAGPTAEAIAVEDRMAVDIVVERPTVEDLTAEDTVAVRMAVATAVADNESGECWGKCQILGSGIVFCYRETSRELTCDVKAFRPIDAGPLLRGGFRFVFDVTVKSDRPTLFPILRVVFIEAWAMSQETVKLTAPRIHHDTDVSAPNHQVSGLRLLHSAEIIGPAVKFGRTRIWIREPGLLIYRMHQV